MQLQASLVAGVMMLTVGTLSSICWAGLAVLGIAAIAAGLMILAAGLVIFFIAKSNAEEAARKAHVQTMTRSLSVANWKSEACGNMQRMAIVAEGLGIDEYGYAVSHSSATGPFECILTNLALHCTEARIGIRCFKTSIFCLKKYKKKCIKVWSMPSQDWQSKCGHH